MNHHDYHHQHSHNNRRATSAQIKLLLLFEFINTLYNTLQLKTKVKLLDILNIQSYNFTLRVHSKVIVDVKIEF